MPLNRRNVRRRARAKQAAKAGSNADAGQSALLSEPSTPAARAENGETTLNGSSADELRNTAQKQDGENVQRLASEQTTEDPLTSWALGAAERFDKKVFVTEVLGQFLWCILGPAAIPINFFIYKGLHGLSNRGMWVFRGKRDRFVVISIGGSMLGSMMLSLLVLYILFQPEDVRYVEVAYAILMQFLRAITIAIKYAYLPLPAWHQLNRSEVSDDRLLRLLLIAGWQNVKPEQAEYYSELSLLTFVGPSDDDQDRFRVKFHSWPRTAAEASAMIRLQGRMPRGIAAKFLLHGEGNKETKETLAAEITAGLDLAMELPPDESAALLQNEDGQGDDLCVPLRMLFKKLVHGVLATERKTPLARFGPLVSMLVTVFFTILPSIGRLVEGKSFFGEGIAPAIVALTLLPTFLAVFGNISFLFIAVLDMWRRRLMIRCCIALVSGLHKDRKSTPPTITALPTLDLRDPQTVESFWLLRGLCMDWGKIFSLRCGLFSEVFALACLVMCAYLAVLIQYEWYDLISRTLLIMALGNLSCIGSLICFLALLGEGVNSAADRKAYILEKQSAGLTMASFFFDLDAKEDAVYDADTLDKSSCLASLVAAQIVADQENDPVKFLGMHCGLGLIRLPLLLLSW
eukprot:TRINITY_DN29471_c0_g5_i4.p1 TRINITY_DN29471_c0_g5~~TRINITY_DN29471_c0_g5_i4.p1  ORF type:complete len:631 (-),score=86.89 TRINITY_DN29471_c0_g5_i4:171-2063(-)